MYVRMPMRLNKHMPLRPPTIIMAKQLKLSSKNLIHFKNLKIEMLRNLRNLLQPHSRSLLSDGLTPVCCRTSR